jgi:hypothetical protein
LFSLQVQMGAMEQLPAKEEKLKGDTHTHTHTHTRKHMHTYKLSLQVPMGAMEQLPAKEEKLKGGSGTAEGKPRTSFLKKIKKKIKKALGGGGGDGGLGTEFTEGAHITDAGQVQHLSRYCVVFGSCVSITNNTTTNSLLSAVHVKFNPDMREFEGLPPDMHLTTIHFYDSVQTQEPHTYSYNVTFSYSACEIQPRHGRV